MAELLRKNQLLETSGRAKAGLFAAAIHDLRQPLQALMLFSNALSSADLDTDRLHRRIEQIRQSVDFLDRLLTGLLDLTQIEAGRTPPRCADLALDPLLDEVRHHFRAVAEAQGVRLVVRPTGAWARCDGVMLARILNNLVSNSLRPRTTAAYSWARGGIEEGIRIDVCDTGVGIPPRHQTRVFEAFYRIDAPEQSAARGRGLESGAGHGAATGRSAGRDGSVALAARPGHGGRRRAARSAQAPA